MRETDGEGGFIINTKHSIHYPQQSSHKRKYAERSKLRLARPHLVEQTCPRHGLSNTVRSSAGRMRGHTEK